MLMYESDRWGVHTQYTKAIELESKFLTENYLGKVVRVITLSGKKYNVFISNTASWINGFYCEIDCDGQRHCFFSTSVIKDIYPLVQYCECCGRPTREIVYELSKVPFVDGERCVGKHYSYESHPEDIYDDSQLNNCGGCGAVLKDEDIHIQYNYPILPNDILGYKCSQCGYESEF